jgi:LCP family protein required for cell wall assembly
MLARETSGGGLTANGGIPRMSDDDPWKGWYQPPSEEPTADATQDMTKFSSRMPPAGGNPPPRSWPQQPPPSSSGNGQPGGNRGSNRPGNGGYPGGGNQGYGGNGGYTAAPPRSAPPTRGGRRWRFWGQPGRHGRRIVLIILVVILLIIAGSGASYFWLNGKLHHSVTLPATSNTSAGTNWLIAGSDTRDGVSRTEKAKLHLGSDQGDTSDSLMLLHTGPGGDTLVSIPRDSYVEIPGHGMNKINAALAIGGPSLLTAAVENLTGLKINHYMSIGFVGLADVVNSVGGVRICVKTAISADSYSGFKGMKAGCHELSGTQAIAFVRDRHSFATSDLQRIQDQRAFLAALLSKATSPGLFLNPFSALPFGSTAASSIAVDKGTSLYNLLQVAFALKNPRTGTVPIETANYPTSNAGDAVKLDSAKALELFNDLKNGKKVPSSLLGTTKAG